MCSMCLSLQGHSWGIPALQRDEQLWQEDLRDGLEAAAQGMRIAERAGSGQPGEEGTEGHLLLQNGL